jgi:drug/metabolite transporter (DMT)-like permease
MPSRTSSNAVSSLDLGLLLYLGAVWGGAFLFFRVAAPEVGPVWTAELRVLIAGLVLAAFTRRAGWQTARANLVPIAVVGLTFSAIPFTLLAFATLTLPASLASVLMATTPLFTALVAAVWLRQGPAPTVAVGLGIGFGAVVLLVGGAPIELSPAVLVAVAAGLGAAFSYAIAGTYVRRRASHIAPLHLATGQLVAAAILLLPVAVASGPLAVPSPAAAGSLVAMAVVSTAIAWPVYFRIAHRTSPTAASSSTFIVPMFGMLWGGLVLGEAIGPELIGGFGLVLASLVLVLRLPLPVLGRVRTAAGHTLGRAIHRAAAAA